MSDRPGGYFAAVPVRLVQDPTLSVTAKAVALALACHTDRAGLCWPSRARLAGYLGLAPGTVSRSLRELSGAGYLEILPRYGPDGGQRSSLLRLLYDLPRDAVLASVEEAPPLVSGDHPPLSTGAKGPLAHTAQRTISGEQHLLPARRMPFDPDSFTDPVHREAFDAFVAASPTPAILAGEVAALLGGARGGGAFSVEDVGHALVDLHALGQKPTSFMLKRFAQKARASRDLPDPTPRAPRSEDIGRDTIARLEARAREEKKA